jgi:two-component system, response regulator YesN
MPSKILLVDDNEDLRREILDCLDSYDVVEASSGENALATLRRANDIALVIMDVMMPGISGLDALAEIKHMSPAPAVVILTGYSSKDVAIEALKAHADDYIEKPINIQRFLETVDRLMARSSGEPEVSSMTVADKMKKVQRFIRANCFKKINLADAAAAVSLSRKYVSRVFKEQVHCGFNAYKLRVKMGKAKELLSRQGYTVSQISRKLGYENAESFIRQFKKIVLCTPSAYRDSLHRTRNCRERRCGHGPRK